MINYKHVKKENKIFTIYYKNFKFNQLIEKNLIKIKYSCNIINNYYNWNYLFRGCKLPTGIVVNQCCGVRNIIKNC